MTFRFGTRTAALSAALLATTAFPMARAATDSAAASAPGSPAKPQAGDAAATAGGNAATAPPDLSAFILTPEPATTPRINGPRVYGAWPGRPFLYRIPTTGERPITFAARGLPRGLSLDEKTGFITGRTEATDIGSHKVTLTATNAHGSYSMVLDIVTGDSLCLTPPMGWNSWNCFGSSVNQEKLHQQAQALAASGLADHGWTYLNIDDTWQGTRSGPDHALQPNDKFPDMKALCDEIHSLGLKAGIYSTPWVTSYAGRAGGSAENPEGTWTKPATPKQVNKKILPWAVGKYSFAQADARQWAAWGFDYLKYDWNPIETPQVQEMAQALKDSGREFVFSLSNKAPLAGAADWARYSNCWRTTGDIRDTWRSLTGNGFSQDRWADFAGPGHWNDPDMLVVGLVGWGRTLHPSHLTPDEQYTHMTLWCLEASPLLLGCDLTQLDAFTRSLLTNDEVLAVDQDPLGREAHRVKSEGGGNGAPAVAAAATATAAPAGTPGAAPGAAVAAPTFGTEVWAKPLLDGSVAVGLFNRGDAPATVSINWNELKLVGPQRVRDLWRQKDLGQQATGYSVLVAPHGAAMIRVGTTELAAK